MPDVQVFISREEYNFWMADDPEPKPPMVPSNLFEAFAFYAKKALELV
jgi:hypothetical protein